VSELAEPLPISIQAVSKHLKVLEGAGLITRGRTAQLRPSHLQGAPLKQIAEWVEGYRSFWEGGFERMETRLKSASRETVHG
jgi:DNA-binding transcriptional ArsR family regulator